MFERDYLLREVQKLSELIAKIARLRTERKLDPALDEIASGYERFGMKKSMLEYLDPSSLVRMVGSAEVVGAVGRLMEQEAAILEERGDPSAEAKRARAQLLIEAATSG